MDKTHEPPVAPMPPPPRLPGEVELVEGDRIEPVGDAGHELLKRVAAKDPSVTAVEVEDALEYLLSTFEAEGDHGTVQHRLAVNVGTRAQPRKVAWVLQNIPGRLIRKIRADAEEEVRRRRGQQDSAGYDAGFGANLRIVVEGTVRPDLKAGAARIGIADPADFLEMSLEKKQGLVEQLAGVILTLSGYDEDDVVDEVEVTAAGNS